MQTAIVAEIQKIIAADPDGLLRPESMIEFAKNPKTELHAQFTWDNSEAAHQHRLWEARQLIRVWVQYEPRIEKKMRVMVSLPSDRENPGGGYRSLVSVMSNDEHRAELLECALTDIARVQQKYGMLTELAGVWDAAEKVRRKQKTTKRKPQPAVA